MTIEEQLIIKSQFDNSIPMLCEMDTDITLVAELTIDDVEETNPYLGKLFYNSEYYEFRILDEVNFNDIKLK